MPRLNSWGIVVYGLKHHYSSVVLQAVYSFVKPGRKLLRK